MLQDESCQRLGMVSGDGWPEDALSKPIIECLLRFESEEKTLRVPAVFTWLRQAGKVPRLVTQCQQMCRVQCQLQCAQPELVDVTSGCDDHRVKRLESCKVHNLLLECHLYPGVTGGQESSELGRKLVVTCLHYPVNLCDDL